MDGFDGTSDGLKAGGGGACPRTGRDFGELGRFSLIDGM
jgi:hypothetical protein